MTEPQSQLSPQGRCRAEAILAAALAEGRHRRRRRRVLRGAGAAGTGALLVAIALLAGRSAPAPEAGPISTGPTPPARSLRITRIPTEPNLAARLTVRADGGAVERISEDQLLQALHQAGRPAGLVYVDGQGTLLYHSAGGS